MDIHTLQVYLGLCRNLHFGRTSDEFHMSASALSRLVQKLENAVGHQLLVRDNRSVSLTEQGRLYRQFALETQSNWDKLIADLNASDDELSGKLTLFATVTASQSILPNVLKRFRQDYPSIQIQLETGYAVNAMQQLREGVDVVVAALDADENEKITKKIIMSMSIVAVASELVCQQIGEVDVDWSDIPLILPTTGPVRENINLWFRQHHIRPKIVSEVAGNEATLSLAALACGVGFVPELVLENSPLAKQLVIVDKAPQLADFNVGFCVQKRSLLTSKLVQAFWNSI